MRAIRRAFSGLLVVACIAAGSWAPAEVGVTPGAGGSSPASMILLGAITDDPDPILNSWIRWTQDPSVRAVLNPQGAARGDGPPAMLLVSGAAIPVVVWARRGANGFDVVVSRFAGGVWSEPEVLAGGPLDELDPALAAGPDGGVHVFWWEAGASPRVLHRQATPDLSAWSEPEAVSSPGEAACRPSAATHDGVLHVAYEVHDHGMGETPREIILARREGAGFVPEFVATCLFAGEVRPEVHSHRGRLWVDWIDGPSEAAWTRLQPGGGFEPIRYEPYAGAMEREFLVRGAIRIQAAD